jgi:hypothetical protein
VLACTRPVWAQSASDSAAAQALFDQAKVLMKEGRAKEACPKLEESQRLDPGSGTLINLARCYEQLGRIASAWSKYLEAASAAQATGNTEREGVAREQAAALRPRVSNLVIVVVPQAKNLAGLEVTRDGELVGPPQWGLSIPADEGEHTIAAKAPGHAPWQTVAVVKGEGTTATVTVPALTAQAPETPAETKPETGAPVSTKTAETKDAIPGSGLGMQRTLAIVAGGIGVVGLGVGTVFGLKSKSNHDDAEKYCDGSSCTDARGVTAGNDAYAAGNVATVGMVVGVLGLAGGVTLWLTAPASNGAPATQVGLGLGHLHIKGAW